MLLWLTYALLSAITFALSTIFERIGMKSADPVFSALVSSTISSIFLFFATLLFTKLNGNFFKTLTSSSFLFITLGGIAIGFSWIFYLAALKYGSASKVFAISRTGILFTLFFCITILGECYSLKMLIGAITMTLGAILIAL